MPVSLPDVSQIDPTTFDVNSLSAEELPLFFEALGRERARVLKEVDDYQESNLILYTPKRPNPAQRQILEVWGNPHYKVFTYTGANRIGKTTLAVWIAYATMFGAYPWDGTPVPLHHHLPRRVRYIGQDWEKHIQAVVVPALDKWWPRSRPLKTRTNSNGVKYLWVDLTTKSTLEIMSNNQDSDLHEGWDGDLVVYDEPPKRAIRVANARGLIDRRGRELFAMTLLKEAWVDREVIKARNEDGTPDTTVFNVHASIEVNIGYGLTQEGVDDLARKLRPEERDARLKGIPTYMKGLVLPEFRREVHLKPRPRRLPLDLILDVSIDFHPSKPWDVMFMATDSRNFKWVVDEIHENGSWKFICDEIVRKLRGMGCRVSTLIIDPLAKGDPNSDLHEESVYEKMANYLVGYGYALSTASKDKEGGISIIRDYLMTENEIPALFFLDDLRWTTYEVEGWMYDKSGKPSKEEDDMCENLYRLMLLGTQWEPVRDEDEPERRISNDGRNKVTGY
jgi:hypothetical protein